MKKVLCNTLIIIFMLGVCINVHPIMFGVSSFSSINSYAADGDFDGWQNSNLSMQAKAFLAYCKSNNLIIDGSGLDVLTSWTTDKYYHFCNVLGINPTELEAEIKYATDSNLGLRFLFTNTGATAMNRIFSAFLQNHSISVGEPVIDNIIYSGKKVTDLDGYKCYAYVVNNVSAGTIVTNYESGSIYRYDNNFLQQSAFTSGSSLMKITYHFYNSNTTSNMSFYYMNVFSYRIDGNDLITSSRCLGSSNKNAITVLVGKGELNGKYPSYCNMAVIYDKSTGYYYSGFYFDDLTDTVFSVPHVYVYQRIYLTSTGSDGGGTSDDVDITVDSDGDNITNNNYTTNNYTIIYNDGDTYYTDDDDEPSPDTPPGGGGNVDPDPDDPLDPYDPTKPFPDTPDNPTPDPGVVGSPGSDGTITFPDFNFDLPDINWSLDGLQHKFPFSLPFDLYNACKLLNAEPETPELDYTIDLVVYQWPVNYDLHWLDPAARVIRIFELLAFVVGLILITRHIIGG